MSALSLSIRPNRHAGQVAVRIAVAAGVALAASQLVVDPAFVRAGIVLTFGVLAVGLAVLAPRRLLVGLVIWLAALGLTRRLVSLGVPSPAADPLLLLAPLALTVLVLVGAQRGGLRRRSPLSSAVLVLSGLTVVGAVNPVQESLVAGIAGLLFVLVPMLAFWVGRALVDGALMRKIFLLVSTLSIPAGLYGLSQTFRGFPVWDERWIAEQGYSALYVGDVVRPFSTFSSSSEYATFLAIGIVGITAFGVGLTRFPLVAAPLTLLAVALVYQSGRGIVVLLILALALMLGAARRLPLVGAGALALTLLLALPFILKTAVPESGGTASSPLIEHQLSGLSRPFDEDASTLSQHLTLMKDGFAAAVSEPLGHGTSAITIAGSKFGGDVRGTETDPSNAALALGIPGVLAYLVVLVLGFRYAYGYARTNGSRSALCALGVLTVTLFQWLNGGQYAVALLPWLVLGWVDAERAKSVAEKRQDDAVDPD